MSVRRQFKSIRTRLTFWFMVIALVPLALSSITMYLQRADFIREEAFQKLTAVRDLKIGHVNAWLDERTGNLRTFSQAQRLQALETIVMREGKGETGEATIQAARDLLNAYQTQYTHFDELFFIHPGTGRILVSTNRAYEGHDKSDDAYFSVPLKTGDLFIKDIYYSQAINKPSMTFSLPVRGISHEDEKHIVGILVARIDLHNSLYALLMDRTGIGKSGETLIVNQNGVALNELRWKENAPLRLKVEAKPALLASRGKSGIIEADDYRGEKILGAYGYIQRTGWGFVAKQDLSEVYAPIRTLAWVLLAIFLVSGAAAYGLSFVLAMVISRPIREMTRVSDKIEEGDLTARNRIETADELGSLSRSFNRMADSMVSQMAIQKGLGDISETMVAAGDMETFMSNLLKNLADITGSHLGVAYLRKEERFEPVFSLGANPELLGPFDPSILEGELGRVLFTKKISHIKDIPEDTVFRFRTSSGTALPKEIITAPLLMNGEVRGIISLAGLYPYSQEVLEILNRALTGIHIGFSNAVTAGEMRRLAEELNEKNQELTAQAEELQSQTEELQQTSDELQEQNTELEIQRRQVEEANRLKSEFLSNMSHELRTPLNSVMALSRVLISQASQKLSEEEANYLKVIERNGKNLLVLINDILDLAKIEAGRMDISLKPFSIKSAVETIIERVEPLAEEKGLKMNLQMHSDLPQIESDEIRVHQILQNIIGNAVKFTHEGDVTVTAVSDAENIHIEIADTGIGIAEKDLPHIFEEFRQVDGSSARTYEGTGLGLTIAYRAARMLGGELRVESVFGKGSIFTLTLPIKWPEIMPGPGPVAPMPPVKIVQARKAVLVADDDPGVAAMIADYLIREGYGALTATSGKQALELALKHRPFAITLDVIMPDMDGWEVLQRLKENPDTKDIPVIIISVADDKEIGFALGAVGYITKPVNKDVLIAEINRIGGPAAHTVLIVDDNALERSEMAQIVEQEGLRAVVADGGATCMRLIGKSIPDVLVLDLMMPDMDGFAVLEKVRSDPATRNLPVIVVTAKELTDKDRKKLTGKVSSILAKSDTTSTALLEEIKQILGDIDKYPRPGEPKTAKRILLVEDNEAAMIQVRGILESEGYGVDVARGGQEALEYLKETKPDGIILDLMMPEVDGFAVLQNIRTHEATEKVPVLILTAKDLTPEDLKKIRGNNVQHLVQKGDVARESLLAKVRAMLGGKARVEFETGNLKLETPKPAPSTQHPAPSTEHPAAILVVEDNPDNMISIKAVLGNQYAILEATDGEDGLKKALTQGPDLILLDMSLPGMDGFAVTGRLKEADETRHIPVIAMTARAMKGDREMILGAGCDDYISKPIEPEDVLKKIEEWLRK